MDSGNGAVSRRRTRQQTLKYMIEFIEKRNKLSQSGSSTMVSCGRKRKLVEPSGGEKGNVENNGRRKFSHGTHKFFMNQTNEICYDNGSEVEGSDPDVVIIGEEAAPVLNATDEVVSSTSSMCRASIFESESEASTDDVGCDFDGKETEQDDVSCRKENEIGKKELNQRVVPQLVVEGEKHNIGGAYFVRPRSLSKSKKKNLNKGSCSSPILLSEDEESDDEESKSSSKEDCEVKTVGAQKDALQKSRRNILEESEVLKFVVDSVENVEDQYTLAPLGEKEQVLVKERLPLIFRFEDEDPLPPEKEEWEKEIEDLFVEMDMCVLESHIGFTNQSDSLMHSGQISDFQMRNHHLVLDEEIGLICSACSYVYLESKYIFPPFAQSNQGRYERKYFGDSPSLFDVNDLRFSDSLVAQDSPLCGEGTVWDLTTKSAKATLFPHRRGGFKRIPKNPASFYKQNVVSRISAEPAQHKWRPKF